MKVKLLHIVLIIAILIESVIMSAVLLRGCDNKPQDVPTISFTTAENGSPFSLISASITSNNPSFEFVYDDATYHFTGTVYNFFDCYRAFEIFQEYYPELPKEAHQSYKDAALTFAHNEQEKSNPSLSLARAIGKLHNDAFTHAIDATTGHYTIIGNLSLDDWNSYFAQYAVNQDEMALPSIVRVGDTDHTALCYYIKQIDSVQMHVMFGSQFIGEYSIATPAIIYMYTPDGATLLAQTSTTMTFTPPLVEQYCKTILEMEQTHE